MCTLLKVANRRLVNLISPFFVHEEQITFVGSTSDNSVALAQFSCTVRIFSVLSAFFTCFCVLVLSPSAPRKRSRWSLSTMQRIHNALRTRTAPVADYLPTSNPGLDGHPRRITPIPMATTQSCRTSQSTIGHTSISTREGEFIKKEVRDAINKSSLGSNLEEKSTLS